MAQATFSVRMDEVLKKQFDALCQEFGMNASTAINVFARAVVRQRTQAKDNGISDMSLDDINKEIHLARMEADV